MSPTNDTDDIDAAMREQDDMPAAAERTARDRAAALLDDTPTTVDEMTQAHLALRQARDNRLEAAEQLQRAQRIAESAELTERLLQRVADRRGTLDEFADDLAARRESGAEDDDE